MADGIQTTYDELADVLDCLPMLVRETRRRRSLSLRAAASEIGISNSTLLRYEGGEGCNLTAAIAMLRWVGRADWITRTSDGEQLTARLVQPVEAAKESTT